MLNNAEDAGTVTNTATLIPFESAIDTDPLPLLPTVAEIVNVDPFTDALSSAGVSVLTV